MAEIKIEKKKRVWPWILLALVVIAVLIYFLAFRDNTDRDYADPDHTENRIEATETAEPVETTTAPINVNENNSTVEAYVGFVETSNQTMKLDHAYTNEALSKLTDATNAMAKELGYEVQADIEKAKEYAEMIMKDPFETTHADNIRKAGDLLTKVLQNIQKAKYPGLANDVEDLRNASESIKPGVLTLDQRDEVKTFFAKAADLIKKMN